MKVKKSLALVLAMVMVFTFSCKNWSYYTFETFNYDFEKTSWSKTTAMDVATSYEEILDEEGNGISYEEKLKNLTVKYETIKFEKIDRSTRRGKLVYRYEEKFVEDFDGDYKAWNNVEETKYFSWSLPKITFIKKKADKFHEENIDYNVNEYFENAVFSGFNNQVIEAYEVEYEYEVVKDQADRIYYNIYGTTIKEETHSYVYSELVSESDVVYNIVKEEDIFVATYEGALASELLETVGPYDIATEKGYRVRSNSKAQILDNVRIDGKKFDGFTKDK